MVSDQLMLRLLQGMDVTFEAEWARAEAVYAAANPLSAEPKDLKALADAGWVRVIWGRVAVALDLRQAAFRVTTGQMLAFQALLGRIYTQTYRWTEAVRSESDLAALIASIESEQKDPSHIICQTPAWVAARLWECQLVKGEGGPSGLRHWVDLWGLLQSPALVPDEVWRRGEAKSFREAAVQVIASEAGLEGWSETRAAYVRRMTLAHNVSVANVELRIPEPPSTLVDRALWLEHPMMEGSACDVLDNYSDVFGLVRLLLANVVADDNAPAPHPMAVRLIDLAINRTELFLELLFHVRAHPMLLADLLLHPPTTALACLLVAQWRSPTGAWDRSLAERDDRIAQVEVFADAAAILGEYLQDSRATPAEAAALLNWFHERAGCGFIDDVVGNEALLVTLRRELAGVAHATLRAMAESLVGPGLQSGLSAPEFAAILDLVDLGGLATDLEPAVIVEAYVQSIRAGEYGLTALRIGVASAVALAQLAARTSELRQTFLYPLQIQARLAAATTDDNIYILTDSIGRSVRAHIRILSRVLVGSRNVDSDDLVGALVAAVRVGALEHKEKGRVSAFAPRFEESVVGPLQDRPLAADLGAALCVLSGVQQTALLDAVLETDEPLILAQLLSFVSSPMLRARIEQRITALAPSDAGAIRSLPEMQARIDELLTAGVADAAARYMDAEVNLKTLGQPAGREFIRFRNQLRLHYLREDWSAIVTTPSPTFQTPLDQASAEETLKLFKGIAALKGPTPNPEEAKTIFADLFARRPATAYASNWFAAELNRLLHADSFGLLKGAEVLEGRRALAELERMLTFVPANASLDDEVTQCNKALLLLAIGEPSQALAVVTMTPLVRLQDTAAAYRAVALARLGQRTEAVAALDTAEHSYGTTTVLVAAREHIASGIAFSSAPDVSFEDDVRDIAPVIARFRTMHPTNQARVLNQNSDPFVALVVEHVRAAADSVVSLVPMMKGVRIDAIEDDLTAFIHHLLAARVHFLGWSVADQSKGGFTAKGNPGERDLLLKWSSSILALIEAVVCDKPLSNESMRAYLESHFQKLFAYGNARLFFHLTYAYIEDKALLRTFLERIAKSAAPQGFVFNGLDPITATDSQPSGFAARYDTDSGEMKVIFLVLDLGQQRQRQAAKLAKTTKDRKASASSNDT